ncbi:uncharacterized protein C16orf96 homolog [Lacerta agilis]|uniref:uncharacterized protein C16orf96 homolog n=1 Tax=Lacerta agilis TaxID=80427 RepID=UPI00141A093A|nr:uncharacterized protein C16orf96 homolog [Lacerta agilis]
MTHSISFAELINLAIGTPELGNVNFNALHLFLHSLLDHLHLKDMKKEITDDELDFIKPPKDLASSVVSAEVMEPAKKSSSIFHQLHDRVVALEKQLSFLNEAPSTAELLARSQGAAQPAQDMWQIMQLKKKMEMNEAGMTKAMNTLQDLLNNICTLQTTTEGFQGELGQLKENFTKLNADELREQLTRLDEQARKMDGIREQLGKLGSDSSDLVHWSSLCEMLTGKSYTDSEILEKSSREVLATLGQLPEKHEVLLAQITQLEEQMKRAGLWGFSGEPLEIETLLERINLIQSQAEKEKESLQGTMDQMHRLRDQCEKLQTGMERLMKSTSDIQTMRIMLEQLDIAKADKAMIQEEMSVKADKSQLEAKANQVELQSATDQLSDMMQDLLQKMSLQDKDWQKALEKLFTDMDCKLDRMALDPLSRQLEQVWQVIKRYLSEGPRFDADSAAGFKKQLFERVKCISCDRPVTMMTGPHMVTKRKGSLRPRPASASGYEHLARLERKDGEASETSTNQPPHTCWQCQAHHQACRIKRLTRSQDLTTIYPYADLAAITYDNTEVDILGVNGVLYKGRMGSQAVERSLALQREFTVLKSPRPPLGNRMERARSAYADFSTSPYAMPSIRRIAPGRQHQVQMQQQISFETVDRTVAPTFNQSYFKNGGRLPGM